MLWLRPLSTAWSGGGEAGRHAIRVVFTVWGILTSCRGITCVCGGEVMCVGGITWGGGEVTLVWGHDVCVCGGGGHASVGA